MVIWIVKSTKPHVYIRTYETQSSIHRLKENGKWTTMIYDDKLGEIYLLIFFFIWRFVTQVFLWIQLKGPFLILGVLAIHYFNFSLLCCCHWYLVVSYCNIFSCDATIFFLLVISANPSFIFDNFLNFLNRWVFFHFLFNVTLEFTHNLVL